MNKSAGILLYRYHEDELQVMLVHPGGPFWAKKDEGVWSIPKGEFNDGEDPLAAALREFQEETGNVLPAATKYIQLKPIRQKSGKWVYAWALEHDIAADKIVSNMFDLEWPPRSGKMRQFPEIDRAQWLTPEKARGKILPGQQGFIDELEGRVLQK